MEVSLICADEAQKTYLRLRANMTILECLHSETLSLGVVDDAAVYYLSWALPTKGETMRSSEWISESHFLLAFRAGPTERRVGQSGREPGGTKVQRAMLLVLVTAALAAMPLPARSQSLLFPGDSSEVSGITAPVKLDLTYVRPTERTKVNNFAFDAFGPYPIAGAGVAAGINQWTNAPPEWGQGAEGYGKRIGSDFGIAAIGTTARYGLAEAFKEDTLYYRCECSGPFPRLRHAVISTLTGRHGQDGHRIFSISALAAPYAGSMIGVYLWYPDRFGAKDAFRMGNYSMLEFMGGNIALEFLYSGPHSLLTRMHLNSAHGAPDPGPNH
jgi:hypothetical protein